MLIQKTEAKTRKLAITYSRLKNFELCPLRYYEVDVLKRWQEGPSEHLQWGDAVHEAMAKSLKTGADLPLTMRGYGKWINKIKQTPGTLLIEDDARLAIDIDFRPCGWFSPQAWMRSIADVLVIDEDYPGAALCIDWKTGKSTNVDEVQLVVIALMAFIHFPKLLRIRAQFVYLSDDATATVVIDRHEIADQWALLMPRIAALYEATEKGVFLPRPNNLCKSWCPVKSCNFNGRRTV